MRKRIPFTLNFLLGKVEKKNIFVVGKERDMDPCIFGHLCSMCVGHLELGRYYFYHIANSAKTSAIL